MRLISGQIVWLHDIETIDVDLSGDQIVDVTVHTGPLTLAKAKHIGVEVARELSLREEGVTAWSGYSQTLKSSDPYVQYHQFGPECHGLEIHDSFDDVGPWMCSTVISW